MLTKEGIRFGLAAVKHVGSALAQEIVAKRGERPFVSLDDFCLRLSGPQLNGKRWKASSAPGPLMLVAL